MRPLTRRATALALLLAGSGIGFCDSNPVATGVENITKLPFSMMKGANEHMFSPVKDVDHGVLTATDEARAAVVSVGLNLGQAVED